MTEIKKRNPALVFIFTFITLGIYGLYWLVKTKGEINGLGASIPTAWLVIIPIVNLYWFYKYAEGFVTYVKKGGSTIGWWLFLIFLGCIAMIFIQIELNKLATQ